MESELPHRFRIQQISSVEDDRRPHFLLQHREVHVGKFIPVRGDNQRFGITDSFQSGGGKLHIGDRFDAARLVL